MGLPPLKKEEVEWAFFSFATLHFWRTCVVLQDTEINL
jgi:hypothetical protein